VCVRCVFVCVLCVCVCVFCVCSVWSCSSCVSTCMLRFCGACAPWACPLACEYVSVACVEAHAPQLVSYVSRHIGSSVCCFCCLKLHIVSLESLHAIGVPPVPRVQCWTLCALSNRLSGYICYRRNQMLICARKYTSQVLLYRCDAPLSRAVLCAHHQHLLSARCNCACSLHSCHECDDTLCRTTTCC
jgi:hypothetical protein